MSLDQEGARVEARSAELKKVLGVRVLQLGPIKVAELAVGRKKSDSDGHAGEPTDRLRRGSARTFVGGALFEPKQWGRIVDEFKETLALAEEALSRVIRKDGTPELPVEFAAFKAFIKGGVDAKEAASEAKELKEIRAAQKKLTKLWREMLAEGTAPAVWSSGTG